MVSVNSNFHSQIIAQSPVTRMRIYFFDPASVDWTDDNDVQTNGTLLVRDNGDADSNGRIHSNGVTFSEYFTKEEDWEIGACTMNSVSMTFINDDGALDGFDYGWCKIYIDVKKSGVWYPCPMGVYIMETPKKRRVALVSVKGNDLMSTLDKYADNWWNTLSFSESTPLTPLNILTSMAASLGYTLKPGMTLLNSSHQYTTAPLSPANTSFRTILNYIAGVCGGNARFDRNGYLEIKWFTTASFTYRDTATLSAPLPQILSADIAEYSVAVVDKLSVKGSDTDIGTTVESLTTTENTYEIINNPFMYGDEIADITTRATNIFNRLNAFSAYVPSSLSVQADCSIEAGDIISFVFDSTTYTFPIFQQSFTWRGGYISGEHISSGNPRRPIPVEPTRITPAEFRAQKAVHELESDLTQLRSYIENVDGNYTELAQTAESIIQSVGNLSESVTSILDPTGQMWTFINNLRTDVDANKEYAEDSFEDISEYIRFVGGNIVLGKSNSDIKLKLLNDNVMFYSGDDDALPTDNDISVYAMFTIERLFDAIIHASRFVQIGDDSGEKNWQWIKRSNGHISLWRV